MWQQLADSLKTENFAIVAVAEESRGAEHARPWIEQANASYWCLALQLHIAHVRLSRTTFCGYLRHFPLNMPS